MGINKGWAAQHAASLRHSLDSLQINLSIHTYVQVGHQVQDALYGSLELHLQNTCPVILEKVQLSVFLSAAGML